MLSADERAAVVGSPRAATLPPSAGADPTGRPGRRRPRALHGDDEVKTEGDAAKRANLMARAARYMPKHILAPIAATAHLATLRAMVVRGGEGSAHGLTTEGDTSVRPRHVTPGTEAALSKETLAMIDSAVANCGAADPKAFRATLVTAHLKAAHRSTQRRAERRPREDLSHDRRSERHQALAVRRSQQRPDLVGRGSHPAALRGMRRPRKRRQRRDHAGLPQERGHRLRQRHRGRHGRHASGRHVRRHRTRHPRRVHGRRGLGQRPNGTFMFQSGSGADQLSASTNGKTVYYGGENANGPIAHATGSGTKPVLGIQLPQDPGFASGAQSQGPTTGPIKLTAIGGP